MSKGIGLRSVPGPNSTCLTRRPRRNAISRVARRVAPGCPQLGRSDCCQARGCLTMVV